MQSRDTIQFKLLLPIELKDWIDAEAARNRSSRGSEIVRAVRDRMDRVEQQRAAE